MTASPNWEGQSAPMGTTPSSNVWSSRVQWGAILAGAVAGFGVVILMTALGAALGITAGAVGIANTENPTSDDAGKTAMAFGIGSAVWMLLTAVATGLVGGYVLNNTSRRDRAYSPVIFGGLTWTVGVATMLLIAAPSLGGALSGLGAGAGGAAAGIGGAASNPDVTRRLENQQAPAMTEEQKAAAADAAKKAATSATLAMWVMFISQLVALGATVFAAGVNRSSKVKVVTELRPRAAALT